MSKQNRITFAHPADLRPALEALAAAQGRSLSNLIVRTLEREAGIRRDAECDREPKTPSLPLP